MTVSEIILSFVLGLLIMSEIRYYITKNILIKELKDEKNMLKARIASLEHKLKIRDNLLKEYDYDCDVSVHSPLSYESTAIGVDEDSD